MKETASGRVLFVGIGGGNDVFSSLLAATALRDDGWQWQRCDVAGVLSPFHGHTLCETAIPGVFETRPDSTRFLLRRDGKREIGFIDARVASLVAAERPCRAQRVLGLALDRGTRGLAATFAALAEEYETIVLVDVGGDVFYGGAEDAHVLSPMFDAIALRAFVDSGADGFLFEAGPGTDGELEPERLTRAIEAAGGFDRCARIAPEAIDAWDALYRAWIEPHRPGNTVPTTIAAYRSKELVLTRRFRARAHLGGIRKFAEFDQRVHTALCRKYYLVDPARIANPFAVSCAGAMDWFLKTQFGQRHVNNEANLEYCLSTDGIWQFLTPSPLLSAKDRDELLELGLLELTHGVCDGAWMRGDDWEVRRDFWSPKLDAACDGGIVRVRRR